MKILQVITSLLPGGAETLVADLMPCFREYGIDAEIAVFNALDTPLSRSLSCQVFRVHRFSPDGGNVYSPCNLMKLRKLISSGNYDIVHTHNTACQLFGAMCRVDSGTRKVTTEHNTFNRRQKLSAMKYVDRLMYSTYDRVVCISEGVLASLTDFVGDDIAGKCEIIPNGVHLEKYSGSIGHIDHDKGITVIMVAGFRDQKDQDTAVRAMAALPDRFRLILVGDGARIDNVKRLASEIGVGDRIEFTGFRDDVPDLLNTSDIVLMSSHYEGLSLSNIEGMASGRPFVASDVSGLREVTAGAGILFPEGDHVRLAEILCRLAEDRGLYAETAEKCRRRASGYDIKVTARRYVECYGRMMT
ncbi:MAG: glycosyltransferase family 4 protein [Muribaculaceae bacterium]|nr:glycosyltransferase family 4 protein [Muribaculaceae bacterium]